MDNAVTLETLLHGEGLPTASVGAGEGPLLLVEGVDVALQVEGRGERPVAALPGALENHSCVRMDALMLLQEPGVPEHLGAAITPEEEPVLLLPVPQVVCPGLPCEAAGLLLAGISSVHLLVSLQLTWEGESHVAAFISALVRWQLSVLLTHVGLQLLVLLELEPAALKLTDVFLVFLSVDAAEVPGPVGVGGEGLRAALCTALEGLHAAVGELVPGQVIGAAEGLTAAVVAA